MSHLPRNTQTKSPSLNLNTQSTLQQSGNHQHKKHSHQGDQTPQRESTRHAGNSYRGEHGSHQGGHAHHHAHHHHQGERHQDQEGDHRGLILLKQEPNSDNSINESFESNPKQPLQAGHHRGRSSNKSSKRIEELKERIRTVDNFSSLNYCGICVAIAAIISGFILVILAVAATSLFQNASCDIDTTICGGESNAAKGALIAIGVTVMILEAIGVGGHLVGISAYKNLSATKMNCAHVFYMVFLIIGIITANVCWCVIYYMLMTRAQQIKEMLKELESQELTMR